MKSSETKNESRNRWVHSNWKWHAGWLFGVIVVCLLVAEFRKADVTPTAKAEPPAQTRSTTANEEAPLPRVGRPQHDVMALVNGKDISRKDLISACVRRHGKEVLESIVNKRLILNHCEKRGITITREEIAAEIDRMASRFKLGREQWFELLEKERGITAEEYARDIVWPTLALRKLAADDITVSPDEIAEAFEREFGPMVRARLIAVGTREQAEALHRQLLADPQQFPRLAIENSVDVNSASVGGLIQPIRRHVGDPNLERAAFALEPGQISQIVPVAGQFVILRCDGLIPPRTVDRAKVEAEIVERIKDEKLRGVAGELFSKLQNPTTIQNVYNNPQLRETMPGVVATVNGDRITMQELGQECLLRFGEEVLETEISELLLKQALEQAGLLVADADLEAEIRHAAELSGVVDAKGKADLEAWLKAVADDQNLDRKIYLQDSVWPSAALKKLSSQAVEITEEDIQKGFEANYGERVRCRAIVLGNLRRAQEVWDKARRNPSDDYFGDLAEEYSIEPTSRALRGEVPPIQRYGGQTQLEEAAFQLQPGQLSGIVQVGDKFVILRCEGRTERLDVSLQDVRDILYSDLYEKKLRIEMSEKFATLRENSRVDNYLAGTSEAPVNRQLLKQDTAVRPTAAQR